jgi:hypothetical protein
MHEAVTIRFVMVLRQTVGVLIIAVSHARAMASTAAFGLCQDRLDLRRCPVSASVMAAAKARMVPACQRHCLCPLSDYACSECDCGE